MPDFEGFSKKTATFLRGLTKNNNKAWFDANRGSYDADYMEPAKSFVAAIGPKLKTISPSISFEPKVNGSIFRINRDIRFSKDKTPYKTHLDMWFWHGDRRGWASPGFFFRMYADRLILGAGMHKFEKPQLAAFRDAVLADRSGRALAKVIDKLGSAGTYTIGGASRKTVPRGFDADHPRAALLLHEGLFASIEERPGAVVETPEFVNYCVSRFKTMWPISRWLLEEVTGRESDG